MQSRERQVPQKASCRSSWKICKPMHSNESHLIRGVTLLKASAWKPPKLKNKEHYVIRGLHFPPGPSA